MKNFKNVTVLDHPLISHKIAILRSVDTHTKDFRELVEEITMLLTYERLRTFPRRKWRCKPRSKSASNKWSRKIR